MNRFATMLTVFGGVLLAAVTLQSQPFTAADSTQHSDRAAGEVVVSHDLVEQWLSVAEDVDPANAERLRRICDQDPHEFHRVMRQTGRSLIGLAELKNDDPELYELKLSELRVEAQVNAAEQKLIEAIRSGRESEIPALEQDLRTWVRMQVLVSIRARGDYLLRLKEHMQRLEEELEQKARNFDQTVENQFQERLQATRRQAAQD